MPKFAPSASRIAMVLKYACPARSKKLIGSTTPSSLAIGAKWRTARLSASSVARFRWRESCSMQKYGVSNSSGSRMICAPRPAASRTSASPRAMLAAASQPQDIWMAATVTGRAGRCRCSGGLLMRSLRLCGYGCARCRRRGRAATCGDGLLHLLGDAGRGLQRHEARLPGDHRGLVAADALEEGLDLRL